MQVELVNPAIPWKAECEARKLSRYIARIKKEEKKIQRLEKSQRRGELYA